MGRVIGPFDVDDWFTLSQLKLDLAFAKKHSEKNPDYKIAAREAKKKFNLYATRELKAA